MVKVKAPSCGVSGSVRGGGRGGARSRRWHRGRRAACLGSQMATSLVQDKRSLGDPHWMYSYAMCCSCCRRRSTKVRHQRIDFDQQWWGCRRPPATCNSSIPARVYLRVKINVYWCGANGCDGLEEFVIHSVVQAQLLIDGQSEGAVLWSERERAGRRSGRRSEPPMASR